MINRDREWDWMDDIIEDVVDGYVSVTTGSITHRGIED
tara:strand:- start:89 stop:202 length:114 start_codon:yes stop_codon:yes gene_type:complete